jgi:signal transduction histidine kinase/CheY-like chemotaxis protein
VRAQSIAAARVASLLVAATGLTVLAGWFLASPNLTSFYLRGPTVKTNAAIALICGAIANVILISSSNRTKWMHAGRALAILQMMIGGLTLSEHIAGWDLRIDQLLATEASGAAATASPNRMGPPASIANLLLGLSMLLAESRRRRRRVRAQRLALFTCLLTLLPIMGFAYGYSQLYTIERITGISLANSLALLMLAVAILAGRPERGVFALLTREDEVGTLTRGLLPPALLLPFVMGWMLARAMRAELIDAGFAISTMSLVLIVGLAWLIWRTGRQMSASLDARLDTERALAESERSLRESDRQKTEFLATLSHELRNPMAPIRFALELLDGRADVALRARQTIARQVEHLTRLIDDLLDLTRITRNKLELHARLIELATVLNDAVDATASEIGKAGHQLHVEMPNQPIWLEADPDRVVQMLTNLLNNAARYTDAGGEITVGATVEDGKALIYVRDNGQGIAAEDLGVVFDRFVQVGSARHGGLGIGLALVKGLAELHGGDAEARSEGRGKGAEFRVRLPRANAPAPVKQAAPAVRADSLRILVVDDNADAADMLHILLTSCGHDVLVAHSGEDALQQVAGFVPVAGLLDIGMPGMSGYELAAALRHQPATAGMFLVAITGWGQEEDKHRALAAGFDAHLTKPADPEAILALLAKRFQQPGMHETLA